MRGISSGEGLTEALHAAPPRLAVHILSGGISGPLCLHVTHFVRDDMAQPLFRCHRPAVDHNLGSAILEGVRHGVVAGPGISPHHRHVPLELALEVLLVHIPIELMQVNIAQPLFRDSVARA